MKDRRFIELLNLYVDREITPAEAAELEAEVHGSAERRQVFAQYCRLDRACTQVLAQVPAVPAPKLAAALAAADRTVEELPEPSGGRSRLVFLGGLMAAAAAVALVFFNRSTVPLATPAQPQARVATVVPAAAPASQPTGREATVALVATGATLAADRPSLVWLQQMEISRAKPISEEDLKLVARADKSFSSGLNWGLHREYTAFPRAGATRPPTELNAFELRK
jgi:hypothetical protein